MSYSFHMAATEKVARTKPEPSQDVQPDGPLYIMPEPQIDGWMSPEELQWIFSKARQMDSVVEVGCWKGRSTHALLSSGCPIVYAVDHFKGSTTERDGAHSEAKRLDVGGIFICNVGRFENLYLMEMDSVQAAAQFEPLSVDMVWIDGGHDYASIWADLNAWWPKCRKLICGHDANQEGVPQALLDFEPVAGAAKKRESIWYIEKEFAR